MTVPALDTSVDLVANAIAKLPGPFQGKPKIVGLVTALVAPIQIARDTVQNMIFQLAIDRASGVQLDLIGKKVGQARNGMIDADYRARLRVRIMVSKSKGTIPDLVKIAMTFVNNADLVVTLTNLGRGSVLVLIDGTPGAETLSEQDRVDLLAFLQQAAAGGVRVILESLNEDSVNSLTLATSTYFTPATTLSGASTITVADTSGFPLSGTLLLAAGDVSANVEETVTYTHRTATTFVLSAPTAKAHLQFTDVQLRYDDAHSFGAPLALCTNLTPGTTAAGSTTLTVTSTTGFPSTDTLTLDDGNPITGNAERVIYTSKTGTTFTLSVGTTHTHIQNTLVLDETAAGLFVDERTSS